MREGGEEKGKGIGKERGKDLPDQCQAASYIRACAGSGVNATANFGGDAVEEALLGEKLGGPDDYFIRNRPVV